MLAEIYRIAHDNWLLLLVGQYPNGPLGGLAATLLLSVLGIALAFPLSVALVLNRSPATNVAVCVLVLVALLESVAHLPPPYTVA